MRNASESDWQNSEQPEPTRSHKACIAELALRFPCPASIDGDDYAARLDLLTRDTAHLAPGLLRKACDLAAQTARGLPYASEILNAAAVIVEHRQHVARADNPSAPKPGDKAAAYAASNLVCMGRGYRTMQTDSGDMFKLGDINERRGIRNDGTAIEPFFHRNAGGDDRIGTGWYCKREDVGVLARCYADHGAQYRLDGAMIVERAA